MYSCYCPLGFASTNCEQGKPFATIIGYLKNLFKRSNSAIFSFASLQRGVNSWRKDILSFKCRPILKGLSCPGRQTRSLRSYFPLLTWWKKHGGVHTCLNQIMQRMWQSLDGDCHYNIISHYSMSILVVSLQTRDQSLCSFGSNGYAIWQVSNPLYQRNFVLWLIMSSQTTVIIVYFLNFADNKSFTVKRKSLQILLSHMVFFY